MFKRICKKPGVRCRQKKKFKATINEKPRNPFHDLGVYVLSRHSRLLSGGDAGKMMTRKLKPYVIELIEFKI